MSTVLSERFSFGEGILRNKDTGTGKSQPRKHRYSRFFSTKPAMTTIAQMRTHIAQMVGKSGIRRTKGQDAEGCEVVRN